MILGMLKKTLRVNISSPQNGQNYLMLKHFRTFLISDVVFTSINRFESLKFLQATFFGDT